MKVGNIDYDMTNLPHKVAIYPLDCVLILPGSYLSLNIAEPRYLQLIEDALKGNRLIGIIQRIPNQPAFDKKKLYDIGCLARIISFLERGNGQVKISLQGICRFQRLEEIISEKPYQSFNIKIHKEDLIEEPEDSASYRKALIDAFSHYFEANNLEADWEAILRSPMKTLINGLSAHAPFNTKERQALLEARNLKERAEILIALAERFILAQNGIEAIDLQ